MNKALGQLVLLAQSSIAPGPLDFQLAKNRLTIRKHTSWRDNFILSSEFEKIEM